MRKILIGSSNKSKLEFYKKILLDGKIQLFSPRDLDISLVIEEDLFDITGNSKNKAIKFSSASNLPAISDDTGIFIPALNGMPGVAVRRWGGELSNEISDEDWLIYFFEKIKDLEGEKLKCYKHQVITLAHPDGKYRQIEVKKHGILSKEMRKTGFVVGGPFSAHFFLPEFNKVESDLSPKELEIYSQYVREKILGLIENTVIGIN